MIRKKPSLLFLLPILLLPAACQTGYIGHSGSTRLVIAGPVTMEERHFGRDFREALGLLSPHQCHDSTFIQDRVFLERIDTDPPCCREFIIPPSLIRDFFGSNNPEKKKVLREEILFFGDTAFEKHPGDGFLVPSALDTGELQIRLARYLKRLSSHSLVYLYSADTLTGSFPVAGKERSVYHDFGRLNCRIVADLALRSREEQASAEVVVVLLPEPPKDFPQAEDTSKPVPRSKKLLKARKPETRIPPGEREVDYAMLPASGCLPDSIITRLNRDRREVITEFRNLLHCIATTHDDAELKRKFREEADRVIHRIPVPIIEGIPSGDLPAFLATDFTSRITVTPVTDRCHLITGIRIDRK
ncbi:MAG TPA: hypothetical protein PKG48_04340 [Bacteroidales bacterium]|nr:hypothetical protein [Bacteroidales bacterium]